MAYGLKPLRIRGGKPVSGATNEYGVSNSHGVAFYTGDPVKLSNGKIDAAASGDDVLGIFVGGRYINSSGQLAIEPYLEAEVSSSGLIEGFNHPLALIVDDPDATFKIETDATISAGHIGQNFKVSDSGGSTANGLSGVQLHVSSATTSIEGTMVRLIRLVPEPGNNFGDATCDVEVELVNTRVNAID
jgi:hypothetical protein